MPVDAEGKMEKERIGKILKSPPASHAGFIRKKSLSGYNRRQRKT